MFFLLSTSFFNYALNLKKTPALTLPQAQRLVMVVLPLASLNIKQALEIIHYHTQRNYVAYKSHRKKRLLQLELFSVNVSL